ncbi:predicted protein [Naegleria gruberi]|uniref:Predicted protein n=1 Tax=Naegleria gruberi TaxID=5762 RepID=D2VXB1_NAEGR|nr:uncharacterized protein NAEGRDRAFT_81580 [Naegleria gruberi]EFC38598.1 predicted protein [Naegleria gruberi]|eukprot:XP_002671342.1 predicted protein [Naegleria gruberi strain NEG-M]
MPAPKSYNHHRQNKFQTTTKNENYHNWEANITPIRDYDRDDRRKISTSRRSDWEKSPHRESNDYRQYSSSSNRSSNSSFRSSSSTHSTDIKKVELDWRNEENVPEEDIIDLERQWYAEDSEVVDFSEGSLYLGDENKNRKKEDDYKNKNRQFKNKEKRMSAQKSQQMKDNDAWERNRLLLTGNARTFDFDNLDESNEQEQSTQIIYHDVKPPFLDGNVSFTKQIEPVLPVKDVTSDIATASRKGTGKENGRITFGSSTLKNVNLLGKTGLYIGSSYNSFNALGSYSIL